MTRVLPLLLLVMLVGAVTPLPVSVLVSLPPTMSGNHYPPGRLSPAMFL